MAVRFDSGVGLNQNHAHTLQFYILKPQLPLTFLVDSGFIGRSWAMLFASVGYEVALYDLKPEQVSYECLDSRLPKFTMKYFSHSDFILFISMLYQQAYDAFVTYFIELGLF